MSKVVIHKTTPGKPYEFPISIPKDMDLPLSIQLYDPGDDCNCTHGNSDPYDTAGHEFTFEIYDDEDFTNLIVDFPDADWETSISVGQDGVEVADIVGRIFKAAELTDLTKGNEYYFRFFAQDADATKFLIARGTFIVERS